MLNLCFLFLYSHFNAFLLPGSLFLAEYYVFQHLLDISVNKKFINYILLENKTTPQIIEECRGCASSWLLCRSREHVNYVWFNRWTLLNQIADDNVDNNSDCTWSQRKRKYGMEEKTIERSNILTHSMCVMCDLHNYADLVLFSQRNLCFDIFFTHSSVSFSSLFFKLR